MVSPQQHRINERERWPKIQVVSPFKARNAKEAMALMKKNCGVKSFDEMPRFSRMGYLEIATCFPSFQVYACGSRVRGDYVDDRHDDITQRLRDLAGKKKKDCSDFDFWVEPGAVPVCKLPDYADRCKLRIAEHEKIPLPMWNWSKIPESEHASILELYRNGEWKELADVHDKYEVSPYSYCCDLIGLQVWWKFGIDSGYIKNQENGQVERT